MDWKMRWEHISENGAPFVPHVHPSSTLNYGALSPGEADPQQTASPGHHHPLARFGFDQWEVTAKEWKTEKRGRYIYSPTSSRFVILSGATSVH